MTPRCHLAEAILTVRRDQDWRGYITLISLGRAALTEQVTSVSVEVQVAAQGEHELGYAVAQRA